MAVGEIWKMIKRFSSGMATKPAKEGLPRAIAEEILDKLTQVNIDPEFNMETSNQNEEELVTLGEVEFALQNKQDSAPGMDLITYTMIKQMSRSGKVLLRYLTKALKGGEFRKNGKKR